MVDLGLDDERFALLTLKEFNRLLERKAEIRSREIDFPTARLLHMFVNMWSRKSEADPVIPLSEFLLDGQQAPEDLEEVKRQAMDRVKILVKALGGDINL